MASKQVSLKLLVDKVRKRVVYAESEYDFVDIVLSFLTIPLGTVLQLLNKESQIGCMDKLYDSVERLDVKFLQTEACKSMLRLPKNASEEQCKNLVIDIQEHVDYYICPSWKEDDDICPSWKADGPPIRISNAKNTLCVSCGKEMSYKISEKQENDGTKGVFVKENLRYMISDDFRVWIASKTMTLALLDEHNIRGSTALEERNVHVGAEEIKHLIRCLLLSERPLTDMFLRKQNTRTYNNLNWEVHHAFEEEQEFLSDKEADTNAKTMSLKLLLSKSKGKVLFAEVDEKFVELLFSFLTFPLGSIVKCLGGCTAMKCLDNLYGSIDASGFKNCMKSEDCKALLLCPKIPRFYSCKNQLIQIEEQQLHRFCISSCGKYVRHFKVGSGFSKPDLLIVDPKNHSGGAYMNEMMFMVTDELVVEPLSTISCFSFLSRLKISTDDLEERVISVGKKEALSLLKACLTSKTVLTDVFLKKPK